MRRGLVHVLAWSLATGAAVTLSWWGVHTVMTGTAYDPPRALPITADVTARGVEPLSSSTSRSRSPAEATPSPSESRRAPRASRSPSAAPPASPSPSRSEAASPTPGADASGEVKSYDTDGGRAVFDLGTSSAALVSATPASGWSMQVWKTQTWIRVDFSSGADRVSVFCTWHDSAPRVEINDY
ncbi:hypothetical protein QFZ75_004869 [Streptomyces sp. V3I8]|uniref:hypothetical protein n=1 Tax=Streptomyces sp. V3I8 TaxID=3042279 RepID=UPI002787688A|nr:hypothetical protein [Streptomyces sp. V3I8]MDQ1038453.1 hypothetical protein [Streptomyces sp. V3I8]